MGCHDGGKGCRGAGPRSAVMIRGGPTCSERRPRNRGPGWLGWRGIRSVTARGRLRCGLSALDFGDLCVRFGPGRGFELRDWFRRRGDFVGLAVRGVGGGHLADRGRQPGFARSGRFLRLSRECGVRSGRLTFIWRWSVGTFVGRFWHGNRRQRGLGLGNPSWERPWGSMMCGQLVRYIGRKVGNPVGSKVGRRVSDTRIVCPVAPPTAGAERGFYPRRCMRPQLGRDAAPGGRFGSGGRPSRVVGTMAAE